jgi:hypothetical protein
MQGFPSVIKSGEDDFKRRDVECAEKKLEERRKEETREKPIP